MDLADLWGQHKKFILAVAAAILVLLLGRGVLQNQFPYEAGQRDADKLASNLSRATEVPEATVRALETEVVDLRARYAELAGSMRFQVDPDFALPPGEANPSMYFFRQLRETQEALVDAAEKQDIRVPDGLGLKEMAPTDPEEIRRTLLALDVIYHVLVESIGAGVRRVETIRIEDEQRGRARAGSASAGFVKELRVDFTIVGGERSLRSMIAGLIDGAAQGKSSFFAIDKARIKPVKGEDGMLSLEVTVVALQIEKSEAEETP